MKVPCVLAALLALTLAAPSALAQVPTGDAVEEHIRRGVELRRSGRHDEALVEFEAAYAGRRDARTAAQLGLVCQAGGRWLRADALLRDALSSPDDPWIARNRAALEGALVVAGRHLATVDLVGDVPGARVRVNGDDAGALPLAAPLRVLAGTVAIDVAAEGFDALTLRFVASGGESLRERVTMVPVRPAAPPVVAPLVVAPPVVAPPAPVAEATHRAPVGALAVASFAGALVMVAGGVTALALRADATSDYNRQCDSGDARGDCGALRDRAVAAGAFAWTTLPLGALLAIAGGVLVMRDRADPTHSTARSSCGVGPSGVQCAFAF